MGGSQVYLEVGEVMSLEDMLKSVVISSANDAAVALAEHVAGSLEAFVQRMNERAAALGMRNTHFENATGLDDTAQNHLTSAHDIAIMSRALISHPKILEYSSIWMDTIRNGTFGLTNTNRLIRFYRGATGLKTGSTDKAGFCISVTAEREGLSLI
jgi:D-alanyl-D-alanine carboxypeptidase (penicillin-binding protein 5/6)